MMRYHNVAPTRAGMICRVLVPMARVWKNSSVMMGMALSSEVSLTMAMVSLPVGGTMTRIACGRTMRRMASPLLMPRALAASACPVSTDWMPARAISAM